MGLTHERRIWNREVIGYRISSLGCSVDSTVDLHEQLAEAACEVEAEPDTQQTLERSVAIALDLVPHADHAGISIVHRKGRIMTPAASADAVMQATSCSSSSTRAAL